MSFLLNRRGLFVSLRPIILKLRTALERERSIVSLNVEGGYRVLIEEREVRLERRVSRENGRGWFRYFLSFEERRLHGGGKGVL